MLSVAEMRRFRDGVWVCSEAGVKRKRK